MVARITKQCSTFKNRLIHKLFLPDMFVLKYIYMFSFKTYILLKMPPRTRFLGPHILHLGLGLHSPKVRYSVFMYWKFKVYATHTTKLSSLTRARGRACAARHRGSLAPQFRQTSAWRKRTNMRAARIIKMPVVIEQLVESPIDSTFADSTALGVNER